MGHTQRAPVPCRMRLQVLQYTVLPSIGYAISRFWGLQSSLAIGVALVC